MNWKTREILKEASARMSDETVFSEDQINAFKDLITLFGQAIENETRCDTSSVSLGARNW